MAQASHQPTDPTSSAYVVIEYTYASGAPVKPCEHCAGTWQLRIRAEGWTDRVGVVHERMLLASELHEADCPSVVFARLQADRIER